METIELFLSVFHKLKYSMPVVIFDVFSMHVAEVEKVQVFAWKSSKYNSQEQGDLVWSDWE